MAETLKTKKESAVTESAIESFNSRFGALQENMRDCRFEDGIVKFFEIKNAVTTLEEEEVFSNLTGRLRPAIRKCDFAQVSSIVRENALLGMETGLNITSLAQFLVIEEVRSSMIREHTKRFNGGIEKKITKMAKVFCLDDDALAYTASTILNSGLLSKDPRLFDSIIKKYGVPLNAVRPIALSVAEILLQSKLTSDALEIARKYKLEYETIYPLLERQLAIAELRDRSEAERMLKAIAVFPNDRVSKIKKEAGKIAIKESLSSRFGFLCNTDPASIKVAMGLSDQEVAESIVSTGVFKLRSEESHMKVQEKQQELMDALLVRRNVPKNLAHLTGIDEATLNAAITKAKLEELSRKSSTIKK